MATASTITWMDDEGLATLANGMPYGGDRFGIWVPNRKPIGPAVTGLGTGRIHRFEFRRDDTIEIELAAIPELQLDLCRRLQYHLLNGGQVQLASDRTLYADFVVCTLAPDTEPQIDASDRQLREYTFSVRLRGSSGVIGSCTQPNTTTVLATSGLSPTRVKGDDFSAWGLSDYDLFREDTVDNANYENGTRSHPYTARPLPTLPAYFWEHFDDTSIASPYVPTGGQVNRNRISQLAVNGGHRTLKAVKTSDDLPALFNGFEIFGQDYSVTYPGTTFNSIWARLRYQYSANYPLGGSSDGSLGTYLIQLAKTSTYDVTIATGTGNKGYSSDVLTISHKSPGTAPTVFEVPLGSIADMVTTGAPQELVVYAGTAWDGGGVAIASTYRVAVWFGDAFGTLQKFYDAQKPTSSALQVGDIVFMRPKAGPDLVPDGDSAMCYECISWEYEDGAFGKDPYSVEALAWNTLGQSPPSNSFFATRQTISGASGTVAISEFNLTRSETEVGEPHRFNGSLWYEWTAPSTGTATFDTIGSAVLVDTYLGIYTGSVVGSLTEIAVDDDSGGGLSSSVSFAATSGTVYKIQVSYRTNDVGAVTLNWSI